MIKADRYFKENLRNVLENGSLDENPRPIWKDGAKAHTKFVTQVFETYDISKGEFPIPTLRNTAIKTGIREVLWIFQKQTSDLSVAEELSIKWWEPWRVKGTNGIGMRYGATVSRHDLINKLLVGLKDNPFGRRHIMNLWQEQDLKEVGGLDPCAYETLWTCRRVGDDMYIDMTLVQRSSDYITAGYINKIQYVALQMMVASHLGYKVGKFCHLVQNLHIYDRHVGAAQELLRTEVLDFQPSIELPANKNFYDIKLEDFKINLHPDINRLSEALEIAE